VEEPGIVPDLVRKDKPLTDSQKRQRALNAQRMHACAPSLIRRELKTFAKKYGSQYVENDPAFTTRDCANCGAQRETADWSVLVITCDTCGTSEDQDRTAGRNLVTRASTSVQSQDGGPLAPSSTGKKLGARRTRKRIKEAPLATDH